MTTGVWCEVPVSVKAEIFIVQPPPPPPHESQDLRPELLFCQQRHPGNFTEQNAVERCEKFTKMFDSSILREREASTHAK